MLGTHIETLRTMIENKSAIISPLSIKIPSYADTDTVLESVSISIEQFNTIGTESIFSVIGDVASSIIEYIKKFIKTIIDKVKAIFKAIKEFFLKIFGKRSAESRINDIKHVVDGLTDEDVKERCKNIVAKLKNVKYRVVSPTVIKQVNDLASVYMDKGLDIIFESLKPRFKNSSPFQNNKKAIIEYPLKIFMERYGKNFTDNAVYDFLIGKNNFVTKEFDGLTAFTIVTDGDIKKIIEPVDKNSLLSMFIKLIDGMEDQISKVEDRDYRYFEKISQQYASPTELGIIASKYKDKYNLSNEHAADVATAYCGTLLRFATVIIHNINNTTILFNKIIQLFEHEFGGINNDHVIFTIKDKNNLQKALNKLTPVYVVENINCYRTSDCEEYFTLLLGSQSKNFIKQINNTINAFTTNTGTSINSNIFINNPILEGSVQKYIRPICYHEYGHILHGDVINLLNKRYLETLRNPNSRYTFILTHGMYRSLKNELQADKVAIKNCGIDIVIEMLRSFYNLIGDNLIEKHHKLTKDRSSSIKYRGNLFEKTEHAIRNGWRNDLIERIEYWENYREKKYVDV